VAGDAVDWLVEMARFDQNCLLSRLAEAGVLPLDLMGRLAQAIARFHAQPAAETIKAAGAPCVA
jgi:aminoglycoside phosphotransferase family enzyme